MSETEQATAQDAETMLYPKVGEQIHRRPWAILPSTLAVIVDLYNYRRRGFRLSQEEIDERISDRQAAFAARRSQTAGAGGGAIAVLPVYGVIAPKAAAFQSASSPSGTGLDALGQMFDQAMADPSVSSIIFDVDSPGGQVDGVPELAAKIRDARGQKPIVAIANSCAASAAYWIASACDEIVVTPSGEVGSIGVYAAHQDISGALEQEGVKVTLISAGKFKTEGNPFEPLSEEATAAIQADVDTFFAMFVGDVAKGRGVSASDVRDGFGEGRMVLARSAVKAGMADRIGTFSETVTRLARGTQPGRRSAGQIEVEITADTTKLKAALREAELEALNASRLAQGLEPLAELPDEEAVEAPDAEIADAIEAEAEPDIEDPDQDEEIGDDTVATTPAGGTPAALAVEVADLSKPWVRDAMRERQSTGEPQKED